MSSTVDFSSQFGGRDAAQAILPHFKLLKSAAKEVSLQGFPLPQLAFVLRVDGSVTSYELSGPGQIDLDESGDYVSVDIGITDEDRDRIEVVIVSAILSSQELVKAALDSADMRVDANALDACLRQLCDLYKSSLAKHDPC